MKNNSTAVITGDVVESTQYNYSDVLFVLKESLTKAFERQPGARYEIIRGDSFQIFVPDSNVALSKAFEIRALLRSSTVAGIGNKDQLDAKISIGVSSQAKHELRDSLGESYGAAFLRSGRQLNLLKSSGQRLVVVSDEPDTDSWMNLCLSVAELTISRWSPEQCKAILESIKNCNQTQIAQTLGITQAAVNQRLKNAGWTIMQTIITKFELYY
ncbi:hypothetical protein [Hymenobacter psychrotolerans]|uniref:SatD family (SatD) n=1 Tax=Hymenobacter psychrotolerans DSM 18569 TaxID=1121959 RepID=A0A1M7CU53_9BACT|nr:hypothetical protein [Hymenobacter psychrotolerans]SHL70745.1 hypothetical protein SAMN02746009_03240 [Hymenobacter psychrotolerans DSM 18569]